MVEHGGGVSQATARDRGESPTDTPFDRTGQAVFLSAAEGGVVGVEEGLIVGSRIGAYGDNVELVFPGQITRFNGDKLTFEMAQKLRVQDVIELLIGGTEKQGALFGDGAGKKEMILGRRLGSSGILSQRRRGPHDQGDNTQD